MEIAIESSSAKLGKLSASNPLSSVVLVSNIIEPATAMLVTPHGALFGCLFLSNVRSQVIPEFSHFNGQQFGLEM